MAAPNSYQYDELLELENFMHSQQKRKPSAQVSRPTPNTTRTHTKKLDAVSPQINPRIREKFHIRFDGSFEIFYNHDVVIFILMKIAVMLRQILKTIVEIGILRTYLIQYQMVYQRLMGNSGTNILTIHNS